MHSSLDLNPAKSLNLNAGGTTANKKRGPASASGSGSNLLATPAVDTGSFGLPGLAAPATQANASGGAADLQQLLGTLGLLLGTALAKALQANASGGSAPAAPASTAAPTAQPLAQPATEPASSGSGETNGISPEAIKKAAGGNKELEKVLMQIASKPKGAAALKKALDKGVTFTTGAIDGVGSGVEGVTTLSSNAPPKIKLENLSIDVVAHEIGHAAFEDSLSHEQIYQFGRDVADEHGVRPIT